MLRALFERGVTPDLVLGTSVGALNGAMVAREPRLPVIERLTDLWAQTAQSRDVYGDRPLRNVRRAVSTGTHIYSAKPLHRPAGRGVRRPHLRRPRGGVPGVRGQHRARRRALVRLRPAGAGDRGQRRGARAAPAAGRDRVRRRALPRRRAGQLDPGRAGRRSSARPGSSCSRSAASTGRSRCPSGRGTWPGCASRSPAGTASPARWPSSPTTSRPTCCPAAARRPRTTRCWPSATSRGVQRRIDATYDASIAYLDEHLGPDAW